MMSRRLGVGLTNVGLAASILLTVTALAHATPTISSLAPSAASPQPIGTVITWTATATDTDPGQLVYRFSTKAPGASSVSLIARDFHTTNTFMWAPISTEGTWTVQATVTNQATNKAATLLATFKLTPIATTATGPLATKTAHPLVALYSAPPCAAGSTILVSFKPAGSTQSPKTTNLENCTGTTSMNFYIAGMEPNTPYLMVHKVFTGGTSVAGPNVYFRAGAIPANIVALTPATTIVRPVDTFTSTAENMILLDYISPGGTTVRIPTLVDLAGNTIWYYPALFPQFSRFFIRPLPGGTMLIFIDDPTITVPNTTFQASQLLREFDLAGNTVRETNVTRVAQQLAAKFPSWNVCNWSSVIGCADGQTAVLDFHHDSQRLPNGHTLVLMSTEKVFTDGTQGSSPTNPIDILGDLVVDLDVNFQVSWAWNSYLQEDLNRAAVLGETCTPTGGGCPPFNFLPISNDWLHSNSLHYSRPDGSVLVSQRHQDFVLKLNYVNGTGDGHIVWRLGLGGDFAMTGTSDPYPWFSHQHHAGWDIPGQPVMSMFDNGNTRVSPPPTGTGSGDSRGYVINVDETNMTATPLLLADLGNYSFALGTAQRLSNTNHDYAFTSGIVNPGPYGQSIEVVGAPAPTGTLNYTLQGAGSMYRAYRLSSLYKGFTK